MSLINEALKRAAADKQGRELPTPPPPAAQAVAPAAPPSPAASTRPAKRPAGKRRIGVAVVLALLLAGGGLALRYWDQIGQLPPEAAVAKIAAPAKTALASPATSPARPKPATAPAPPKSILSPEAQAIVDQTVERLKYYQPPPPQPASRPAPVVQPTSKPAQAATQPAAPAKKKPAVVIDESKYKLSGILRHVDGNCAIINGSVVQVGQTVGDARVVRIDRFTVDLEIEGQRFTIRM